MIATSSVLDAADALAAASLALARRFAAGGTLWCLAPGADHHAHHVAVEFVHPVVVGAPALPAVAIPSDGDLVATTSALVRQGDAVLAIGDGAGEVLARCREEGIETVLLPDGDALLAYHLLWELVHVVLEHPGLLAPDATAASSTEEPTTFLYPFIDADERDPGPLLADLAASAREKTAASARLRTETLEREAGRIGAAATAMADRFGRGGRLLTFGNGGSATDADGTAAAFRNAGLAASSLVDDHAVLTALGNDIGFDAVFARQVGARGRADDIALGISTSGGSTNVLAAFAEARRRGLLTVGVCGYSGGAMAAGGDVEHCVVVGADSVHRIQEAQDAVLRALLAAVVEAGR